LFTLESVRLFSRFAQYVHQILVDRRVSKSRPFQLVPETELARLIEMGVDRHVLESIYNIRELNSLVTLQVDHAHEVRDEMIQQVRVPAGGTVKVLPAQREFDRIYAFVTGEYAKIVSSVELLLQESERRSGKMANVDLRKEFSEALNKIKSDEEKKDKNALLIGERHDLG
ncbi:MAG TPA: hypothetical protein VMU54_13710, partial [Planctomycetota bacterium]|nr:hypothetical protein [Planctomycetota bacterium]